MDYQLPPVAQNPQMNGLPVPVGVMQGTLTHVQAQVQDQEPHRWSQYQQLWRQHVYLNGNSKPTHPHNHSTIKDLAGSILGDDSKSKDDADIWGNVEAQTAFLGPNLWDKSYETDLKYVDLDEFLSENGVSMDGLGSHGSLSTLSNTHPLPKRERSPSPSDCMSPDTMNPPSPADSIFSEALSMASSRDFDPRTRAFSDEELKPQPLIKKSRKQFVPDDLKDDKYWARRRKNNLAAKRSRDARRMKENQIALRAGFLEKENIGLRQELERLKKENLLLQNKLSKYEDV
ncbi:thyrotroph embryonic factor isoform X1 [Coccinella septempunctata]|uniref:thyrotroph embryonic factor isoform X1 n=1 Tax=Coccinella septempunctata TaxID=41139 RepID=UPI001D0953CD|nr:thyrotroph embryonic factor isoform X1 [Coccinella septempunctata]